MVMKAIQKIFGNKSDRDVKKLRPLVDEINEIFETLKDKPDDWFPARTTEFRAEFKTLLETLDQELDRDAMEPELYRKAHRERLEEKFEEILPEAFAMVKEACRRHVGQIVGCLRPAAQMGDGAVRCPAYRRYRTASGEDRGDGHRRR